VRRADVGAGTIGGLDFSPLKRIDPSVERALYWRFGDPTIT
jgi:hypothetical protein